MADEFAGAETPVSGWQGDGDLVGAVAATAGVACFRLDTDRRLRAVTDTLLGLTGHSREVHLDDPPVLSLLRAHGGRVKTARVTGGDYHMTVELPPDASVRAVVDGVQAVYPEAEMLVQRRTTLDSRDGGHHGLDLDAILTERQLAAVEASYYAGFFEWPRESTGEEVADALGISPPTFHQHLRAAERRVLSALLGDDEVDTA